MVVILVWNWFFGPCSFISRWGFTFAIGTSLWILVIFAPEGIGVREGVLFAFLMLCGLEVPVATSISIASRLWFLCGEFFIFFLGLILKEKISKPHIMKY
ncbi:MAG TPA: hypothetical protein EYN89_12675 [Flavobacteriales bacterium]|nr:hypothetical protein [Flavobacteriales bacterium]